MRLLPLEPLLSPREASAYLGVPTSTLAVWRSTGRVELPFVKVGGHVRYRPEDIQRFLGGESRAQPVLTARPKASVAPRQAAPSPLRSMTRKPSRSAATCVCDECGTRGHGNRAYHLGHPNRDERFVLLPNGRLVCASCFETVPRVTLLRRRASSPVPRVRKAA
jgi:excisionase family DNA binding protein